MALLFMNKTDILCEPIFPHSGMSCLEWPMIEYFRYSILWLDQHKFLSNTTSIFIHYLHWVFSIQCDMPFFDVLLLLLLLNQSSVPLWEISLHQDSIENSLTTSNSVPVSIHSNGTFFILIKWPWERQRQIEMI